MKKCEKREKGNKIRMEAEESCIRSQERRNFKEGVNHKDLITIEKSYGSSIFTVIVENSMEVPQKNKN